MRVEKFRWMEPISATKAIAPKSSHQVAAAEIVRAGGR
jgi:hypothetical protein